MPARRDSPSPGWLILLLGMLLCMLLGFNSLRFMRYESVMPNMMGTPESPASLGLGAIIPIVLVVLVIEAFGMPNHPHARSPIVTLVDSMAQSLTFPLFISIILSLLLAGLIGGLNRPLQYYSDSPVSCVYRKQKWHCTY